MTTLAQLAKYAKVRMIENMHKECFEFYKTFTFVKKNSAGYYAIITPQILSSGENVRFWCYLWVEEFAVGYEVKKFPQDTRISVKFPTYKYEDWPDLWSIPDEATSIATLDDVFNGLKRDVIPWFDSINTPQKLVDAISPGIREDIRKEMIKRVLAAYS